MILHITTGDELETAVSYLIALLLLYSQRCLSEKKHLRITICSLLLFN